MVTTETESVSNSWGVGLLWIGTSVLSIYSGMLLGAFLNDILWIEVNGIITTPIQRAIIFGLSIGSIKGLSERFVLQRYKIKCDGWLPITILGWAFGLTAAVGLAVFPSRSGIHQVIGGLIIGCSQWTILRHHLPKAYWWIIASVVGSFALLSWIPLGYTFLMILLEGFIFFIITGFLMGIMTGATLSWLLTLSWLKEH